METVRFPTTDGRITLAVSSQFREPKTLPRSRLSVLPLESGPIRTRVQLVPYRHNSGLDPWLSGIEQDIIDNTKFDASDLASQDLDFEEIFTHGKPQKKLTRVVEVTLLKRDNRKPSSSSYAHYDAASKTADDVHTATGSERRSTSTKNNDRVRHGVTNTSSKV
ncbi:hypothetical protein LTR84_003843 [Exophiala bonariae]|uniref:Uncharacterized protein n=1 Tax=Exophiala bonariae TaxID=1690606 RepID=A0AAV9N6G6_9EURO|nr:hypothetical protein LTR84_003843 [Exophiala bonariae]